MRRTSQRAAAGVPAAAGPAPTSTRREGQTPMSKKPRRIIRWGGTTAGWKAAAAALKLAR